MKNVELPLTYRGITRRTESSAERIPKGGMATSQNLPAESGGSNRVGGGRASGPPASLGDEPTATWIHQWQAVRTMRELHRGGATSDGDHDPARTAR